MKKIFKYFASAIVLAGLVFVSCSKEDLTPVTPEEDDGVKTYTLTITASKEKTPDTKLLQLDPTDNKYLLKQWELNDTVSVYNGAAYAGFLKATSVSGDGFEATLTGQLKKTSIAVGDNLVMKFRAPNYSSQDGTLAGISATCDYAEAEVTVASVDVSGNITTTADALFKSKQAIVKFTIKNESGDLVPVTKLTVKAEGVTDKVDVNLATASNEVFVALAGISSKNLILEAKGSDGYDYSFRKAGVTFDNSKYYGINVKMFCANTTPLTLMAKEAGTITFRNKAEGSVTYRKNDGPEVVIATGDTESITVAAGDKVAFWGENSAYGDGDYWYDTNSSNINCSAPCYVYGNIMSLIKPTKFELETELSARYTFNWLFHNNTNLLNHSWKPLVLPAKKLTIACYDSMFYGCTGLTKAPELPATIVDGNSYTDMFRNCSNLTTPPSTLPAKKMYSYSYQGMFQNCYSLTSAPKIEANDLSSGHYCFYYMFLNCRSLTEAPELPSMLLSNYCYESMFQGCTSLTSAPELPATTLTNSCYARMFQDCSSLKTAPALQAKELKTGCYNNMFSGCSSLINAPELPATTLSESCYWYMFNKCTSLKTAPALPATTLKTTCYANMFRDCSSLTSAPSLSATTLAERCYDSMFLGCKSLTTAPDLPATTLTTKCYYNMFYACTNLANIKCLATDISASECTVNWMYGVASTGTFIKAAGMTGWTLDSVDGIPTGWTVSEAPAPSI